MIMSVIKARVYTLKKGICSKMYRVTKELEVEISVTI